MNAPSFIFHVQNIYTPVCQILFFSVNFLNQIAAAVPVMQECPEMD